jgi:hypothetical protein
VESWNPGDIIGVDALTIRIHERGLRETRINGNARHAATSRTHATGVEGARKWGHFFSTRRAV